MRRLVYVLVFGLAIFWTTRAEAATAPGRAPAFMTCNASTGSGYWNVKCVDGSWGPECVEDDNTCDIASDMERAVNFFCGPAAVESFVFTGFDGFQAKGRFLCNEPPKCPTYPGATCDADPEMSVVDTPASPAARPSLLARGLARLRAFFRAK